MLRLFCLYARKGALIERRKSSTDLGGNGGEAAPDDEMCPA